MVSQKPPSVLRYELYLALLPAWKIPLDAAVWESDGIYNLVYVFFENERAA